LIVLPVLSCDFGCISTPKEKIVTVASDHFKLQVTRALRRRVGDACRQAVVLLHGLTVASCGK
jgi:hypothetical protein